VYIYLVIINADVDLCVAGPVLCPHQPVTHRQRPLIRAGSILTD